MTWLKVDDGLHEHRKFADIPPDAASLWLHAGSWSARNKTDGFVPAYLLRRWRGVTKRSAAELVRRGLFEEATEGDLEGWRFHDWADWQPTKDEYAEPADRVKWRRKKALERNSFLREQVHGRDRGLCRYCEVRVNWSDKRGATGGTYDHVDPAGGNELENVVTACRRCNGRKKDRTPVEASMRLLPVPAPFDPETGASTEQVGAETYSFARETGRGVNRSKSDRGGSEQIGVGPVLNGSGSGPGNGNHA